MWSDYVDQKVWVEYQENIEERNCRLERTGLMIIPNLDDFQNFIVELGANQ